MKTLTAIVLLLAMAAPAAAQSPADSLISRMAGEASGVKSYTASVHTDASVHAFLTLNPALEGTYYHREPDENKVVFTSGMPLLAQQFSKLYPHIDSPSIWRSRYVISTEGDANGTTTFKLVPRKQGRIDHIDAKVDDRSAELESLRWNYTDGGYAYTELAYSTIQGHRLVSSQTGKVEVPHYSAEFSSKFSNFKLNVAIPDSIFTEN